MAERTQDGGGPGSNRPSALLALPLDLDGRQQGLAAVLGLVVVWWISEAIPITGVVGLCRCVILNVASAATCSAACSTPPSCCSSAASSSPRPC